MNEAELTFFNMFDDIRKSDREEDMFGHYDFVIAGGIKVDVKSAKKINRWDEKPNHEIHYVEFRNVRGNNGWLLGDADYIAFEYNDTFLLVKRLALKELCLNKIKSQDVLNVKRLYQYYSREGRKDIITLVPTKDIISITTRVLNKKQKYPIKK